MERITEIEARKAELLELLKDETRDVNLAEIEEELTRLSQELAELKAKVDEDTEEKEEETTEETPEDVKEQDQEREERQAIAKQIEVRELNPKIIEKKEERKMEKFTIASPEYKSAWVKTMLNRTLNEEEKRALGDAITTTATTFVEADADTQGINNGGLLIPTEVRDALLKVIEQESPFLRDITKLQVAGNVDLPFVYEADGANWYAETSCTANEGIEFKTVKLTGYDLAKNVNVTFRLEEMAIDSFIPFIVRELGHKMAVALASAVIYGNGSGKATGAIYGLSPETDDDPIVVIKETKASLSADAQVGAKVYISPAFADEIIFAKDMNGTYPYLAGLPRIANMEVEVEPFLTNKDIMVGNPANYVLNEVRPMTIDKEVSIKCRKTTYGAYGVFDGKPKAASFAKGQLTTASL